KARPIFRHIEISTGRRIVLGVLFVLDAIAIAPRQEECSLLPGQFGGAKAITIELTPSRIVRAMRFQYSPGTSFRKMVKGYKKMLGAPAAEAPDEVTWSDSATRFDLRQE